MSIILFEQRITPRITRFVLGRIAGALILIFVIEAFYVLTASAARLDNWPEYMAYYDLLAEGFRAGHLHLALEPPAELLAKANPFDVQYAKYWLGDGSLYEGHYYLYWGPVPGLILAAVKSLFHIVQPVADVYLVFSFFSVAAIATTCLLDDMRLRLFPRLPYPLFALTVLACALGNPVPYLLASSSIYQAAIAGGQAFLTAGVYFAFSAIRDTQATPPPVWRLLATGTMWACAIACRVSLAPAIGFLVVVSAVLAEEPVSGRAGTFRVIRNGTYLGIPVGLGCSALLVYNKLRFGSWLEAGVSVQLTTWVFRFSPRYFLPNLHQYLFRLPTFSCRFPYAIVPYEVPIEDVLPKWVPFHYGYGTPEPVAGMAWAFPLVWMVPVAIVLALPTARKVFSDRKGFLSAAQLSWNRAVLWCLVAFGTMASLTFVAPLGLYMATMRYLGDICFGTALLATLGSWTLYARASRRWHRRFATLLCVGLGGCTIVLGLLLGYQGYGEHFRRSNPDLSATLVRKLSLCD